jgi:hypothetical protein
VWLLKEVESVFDQVRQRVFELDIVMAGDARVLGDERGRRTFQNRQSARDGCAPFRAGLGRGMVWVISASQTRLRITLVSVSGLLRNAKVKARVEELRRTISQVAVTRAAVDRAYVLAGLKENLKRARKLALTRSSNG